MYSYIIGYFLRKARALWGVKLNCVTYSSLQYLDGEIKVRVEHHKRSPTQTASIDTETFCGLGELLYVPQVTISLSRWVQDVISFLQHLLNHSDELSYGCGSMQSHLIQNHNYDTFDPWDFVDSAVNVINMMACSYLCRQH